MIALADVLSYLERFAPTSLAADWDNVGLLLGERGGQVDQILTCLTVTPESAAEAIDRGAQLIVTHHPILFRATKRLTTATSEGRMLLDLARAGVAVYSPHTSFDNTRHGINERLAKHLGLSDLRPLRPRPGPGSVKLVVFVPDSDLARVSDALFAAGAGHIGQYHECSYRLQGTGTFFGSEASNPTVGQKGRREEVQEWRLEVVCPEGGIDRVIQALRKAHSYEEPAFDIYPLRSVAGNVGEGRLGTLAQPLPLKEFPRLLKTALRCQAVQVVGDLERPIQRVAVACGAAGEFLADAARAGADLFVTGEARFHDGLAAQAQNIAVCLPGHYATERFAVEELAVMLGDAFPEVTVWASTRERDPFQWL